MTTNNINYEKIGNSIKGLREEHKMTQEQLAEQINVSISHIRNIETCNASISLVLIVKLANVFNVPVDYILKDSVRNKKAAKDYIYRNLLKDCSEEQLQVIIETVHSLKKSLFKYFSI